MKSSFTGLLALFISVSFAQEINVSTGKLSRISAFKSQYIEARNVDVWLPDGYSTTEKYAVLYMHDGQMLYDAATTWNKQAWEADEVAGKLIAEEITQKFIIVGVWNNSSKRHPEYFPQKPYESLTPIEKDTVTAQLQKVGRTKEAFQPLSDLYLKFLVTELKPYVDKNYATFSDKDHTFIAGSSMGGLISLYAICEYPAVFGGAACMSTHWPGTFATTNNQVPTAFIKYLQQHLPDPKTHKIYFDYGDQTLDAMYPKLQDNVDTVMVAKGYTSRQWMTKFFPGKDHSEKSWHERLAIPLTFLIGKQ